MILSGININMDFSNKHILTTAAGVEDQLQGFYPKSVDHDANCT